MTSLESRREERESRTTSGPHGSSLHPIGDTLVALAEAHAELAAMRKAFGDGKAVIAIDPVHVCESRRVTTPQEEWTSTAFAKLKRDIMACGYNVQPIKVRPADGQTSLDALSRDRRPTTRFEIVFGHRRHRACLELGLPVHCIVESMYDTQLIAEFVAENRTQPALLSWRLADTLDRALHQGLFVSSRRLAETIHESATDVALLLKMARLPTAIRSRFANVSLPPSCAKSLAAEYEHDPDTVHDRAKNEDFSQCRHPRDVVRKLTGARAVSRGAR